MSRPIYKIWRTGVKEAWYLLSKEEQDALFAKNEEARNRVGGKIILFCESGWSSENWLYCGVEEYPSLEAVQELARCLQELNWFRYFEAEILLGTAVPAPI